jgi:hypothetical protein
MYNNCIQRTQTQSSSSTSIFNGGGGRRIWWLQFICLNYSTNYYILLGILKVCVQISIVVIPSQKVLNETLFCKINQLYRITIIHIKVFLGVIHIKVDFGWESDSLFIFQNKMMHFQRCNFLTLIIVPK